MNMDKNTKFIVGDDVTIISNGSHGTVKSIASYLGEGQNIYIVDVMGIEKSCIESNLELYRRKNTVVNLDIVDVGVNFMIEDRINEIIDKINPNYGYTDSEEI